jgi:hypothetical protein
MKLKPKITLIDHFSKFTDPRIERTKEHKLIDIVTIAICGKMSLNLLSQEKTLKIGVANKRLKAAWDNNYLAKVLGI